MKKDEVSIQNTLLVILSVVLFVSLLINYGISLRPEYYNSPHVNKYQKWISTENVD